jgi:plasmid stabilization system protein ParE
MSYRFLPPALVELRDAADYYEAQVSGLGADFISEVESCIGRIVRYPEAWSLINENFRHCHLRRFPHAVIYTVEKDSSILIVSVFHQSRKPLSWKRNL